MLDFLAITPDIISYLVFPTDGQEVVKQALLLADCVLHRRVFC